LTIDESSIIFTIKDLPLKGVDHNKVLYLSVECMSSKVPKVLVNNGSSINVYPLRTAIRLGLSKKKLEPSNLTVQAYDESSRGIMGPFEAKCKLDLVSSLVLFHILEITTSYNLLLGRAWMHPLRIIPSIVHQKLKLPWK
jgi:hypothetical protein